VAKKNQLENFDQILMDAIDEAFSGLGEKVKDSIYFHLEDLFKIKKQEIPLRISDFSDALEQLFGLGARSLEILIIKNLHSKIKVFCEWPTYKGPLSKWIVTEMTFQEYVRIVGQNFEAANSDNVEMGILSDEQEELQRY